MTTEPTPDSGPVIGRDQAPDHGPNFWAELGAAMQTSAPGSTPQDTDRTQELQTAQAHRPGVPAPQATRQLTEVPPTRGSAAAVQLPASRPRMWPLAAAAAMLVVLGLGFLVSQRSNGPGTTSQVAAGATETAQLSPLDGPDDEASGPAETEAQVNTEDPVPAATPDSVDGDGDPEPAPTTNADTGTASATPTPGDAIDVGPAPAEAIPDFEPAPGALGEPDHLPLDQGLPADAVFLSNWPERAVSWYAVTIGDTTCSNANHSEIRYVNGSGFTQNVRDPQLGFSGEISHFTVHYEQDTAAWLVSCGTQLELYVANLEPTGQITDQTLAWFGDGSSSTVLVQWTNDEVSLSSIEPGVAAFSVDYSLDSELLSRNGGPSRIMLEAGAPGRRSLTPLAATPDAGLTYWAGEAPAGTVSACKALFGSGQSDTIWLRQGEGQWQLAVADDFPTGTVTAAAIEPESLQIAFADVCADEVGRVVIGDQLGDGRIGNVREVDLTPFVPGFAAQLFWVDDDTLRIETDNSEFGFGTVRFDYRLTDGLIVQLD